MREKGFTLAEVLITVGIIGVIASIALPALQDNYTKQQIPVLLAKAINSLETASRQALLETGARNLPEINYKERTKIFSVILAPYLQFVKLPIDKVAYYDVMQSNGSIITAKNMYKTKDGITFIPCEETLYVWKNFTDPRYSASYYQIVIDINGPKKGPNKNAVDIFFVTLDGKGNVIPNGGAEYKEYFRKDDIVWTTKCNKTRVRDARACTASIVENGYNVIYNINYYKKH